METDISNRIAESIYSPSTYYRFIYCLHLCVHIYKQFVHYAFTAYISLSSSFSLNKFLMKIFMKSIFAGQILPTDLRRWGKTCVHLILFNLMYIIFVIESYAEMVAQRNLQ